MNVMKSRIIYISIVLICLSCFSAKAQHLGLKFGIGNSTAYSDNGDYLDYKDVVNIGITYEQILSSKISLKSGLALKEKGFNFERNHNSFEGEEIETFLNIPLTLAYKFPLNNGIRMVLGSGGFCDVRFTDYGYGAKSVQGGVNFNAGIELKNFIIGFDYDYSLTDYSLLKEKLACFNYTVAYRFGGAPKYYRSNVYLTDL